MPDQFVGILRLELEILQRSPVDLLLRVAVGDTGNECLLTVVLHPGALDVVVTVATFALTAIDHHVAEQIIMTGRLPHARVHDDRRLDAGHLEGSRRAFRLHALVVHGDHITPPRLLDVALELDAERAVVPQPVESTVNLRGLENEPASPAERHDFFHPFV